MGNSNIFTSKLEALHKREAAVKASIAAEVELERKRKAREHERLVRIVGEALLDEAARSANFKIMLKQTLHAAVDDEKSRRLLTKHGLL